MKKSHLSLFLLGLIIYEIIVNISNDLYLPALPLVQDHFDVSYYYTQMTIILWFMGATSSQFIAGYLADKYGRRFAMWCGALVFFFATLICYMAYSYFIFCTGRFIQGMAVSVVVVAGYATIHENFDDIKAAQILSIMSACLMIAPTLGPLIGGILLEFITWNQMFIVILFPATAAIVLLYFYMPETLNRTAGQLISFSQFALLLKNKIFLCRCIVISLMYSITLVWIINSPYIFIKNFNLSPLEYGLIQIPVFLSYVLGGSLIPYLKTKFDYFRLEAFVFIGLGGITLINSIFWWSSYFFAQSQSLSSFLIYICLVEFCLSMAFGPMSRIIVNNSKQSTGMTIATYDLFMTLTGTIILTILSLFFIVELQYITNIITLLSLASLIIFYCTNVSSSKNNISY